MWGNIAVDLRSRQLLATHEELVRRLEQLEARQNEQGQKIELVFEAIQRVIEAPVQPKRRIGFPVGRSCPEAEASEPEAKE